MNEAPLWTKLFLDGTEKRNNVVVCFLFYFLHALGIVASLTDLFYRHPGE